MLAHSAKSDCQQCLRSLGSGRSIEFDQIRAAPSLARTFPSLSPFPQSQELGTVGIRTASLKPTSCVVGAWRSAHYLVFPTSASVRTEDPPQNAELRTQSMQADVFVQSHHLTQHVQPAIEKLILNSNLYTPLVLFLAILNVLHPALHPHSNLTCLLSRLQTTINHAILPADLPHWSHNRCGACTKYFQ